MANADCPPPDGSTARMMWLVLLLSYMLSTSRFTVTPGRA